MIGDNEEKGTRSEGLWQVESRVIRSRRVRLKLWRGWKWRIKGMVRV